ncbi:MAG: bifunctional diguanylate cyclase/phosphodiesterase [Marinicella sp.]
MSYQSEQNKKQSSIGTYVICLVVLLSSVLIAIYVRNSQEKALTTILQGQAKRTELKLTQSAEHLIGELFAMSKRWINNQRTSEKNWRADAKDFIARLTGVSTLWWVDADRNFQWGESTEPNHTEIIYELLQDAEFKEILDTMAQKYLPEISRTYDFAGKKWLYIFVPIGSGLNVDGSFIIEVNIKNFIDEQLGDPLVSGFYTEAVANEELVYSNVVDVKDMSHFATATLNLDSDQDGWDFKVYPIAETSQIILSPLPYFIVGAGLVISLLFLIALLSRLKATNQSLELSKQISETEKVQFELEYLANHDTLTHLPNRHYINRFIQKKVKQGLLNNQKFTLLFIDLDHFKDINDTLGHSVGDKTLKKLPVLFNKVFRHDDVIARMGGDEFVVYLPGELDVPHVEKLVKRFMKSLEYPIEIGEHQIRLTGSVGVAFFPQHGSNVVELLSHADAALYRAKDQGRNTYAIYDSEIEQKAKDRVELISRLHTANDRDEFEMFFQPRYELLNQKIIGAEALLRWSPNEATLIAPDKFIDILEETSLIIPITWKMFEKSCSQFKQLLKLNDTLSLSFNISAKQLEHPDFIKKLRIVLSKTDFPAHNLELELTEQTLIQNVENSRYILKNLKQMGISVAIDDFGTGYSSLSYLKNFPVDVLKIDQSFIRDIEVDSGDLELVKTMITMGKNLNITTVAEGVENENQLKLLTDESCEQAQGYYFNKPMPFEQFEKLLTKTFSN